MRKNTSDDSHFLTSTITGNAVKILNNGHKYRPTV